MGRTYDFIHARQTLYLELNLLRYICFIFNDINVPLKKTRRCIFYGRFRLHKKVNESLTTRFHKNYKADSTLNYCSQISWWTEQRVKTIKSDSSCWWNCGSKERINRNESESNHRGCNLGSVHWLQCSGKVPSLL